MMLTFRVLILLIVIWCETADAMELPCMMRNIMIILAI